MKKYVSEFVGTFFLLFCGTGAAVVNEVRGGVVSHVGVAIVWGVLVMALIYTFGEKSGAHMNPAVTIAFVVHRVFPAREALPYILSQLAGAVAASLVLKMMFPRSLYLGGTLPSGSDMQSWVMEFLLTLLLMLTILSVAEGGKERGLFAGIAVGSVVLLEAMFGGPVSGASMNPTRSLAPAIVSQHLEHLWIYLTAPITGSVGAVFLHRSMK